MLNNRTLTVLATLLTPIALAAQAPGDTVTVHVNGSRWRIGGIAKGDQLTVERLDAVVNGRKIELTADLSGPDLLIPGDYRAQLLSERHESPNEIRQSYRILLQNDRSRTFTVTGLRE